MLTFWKKGYVAKSAKYYSTSGEDIAAGGSTEQFTIVLNYSQQYLIVLDSTVQFTIVLDSPRLDISIYMYKHIVLLIYT